MKSIITTLFVFLAVFGFGQSTIYDTITHGGMDRSFILYVPASYTPGTPVPLVFNFHGYTSNADQQMWYGDFRPIADTAGFIIAHPMGTVDGSGQPHWNVGWTAATANDVDFTSALIDSIAADYDINQDRVFSTGMSNGGFMSFHLACNLSNRIAAIASVTGSIVPSTLSSCNPSHPMPMLQIHGDADPTVPYAGGFGWSEPIGGLMTQWASDLNITSAPIVTNMPDIDTTDNCTAERTEYLDGDNCADAIHYRINGGEHTWPGAFLSLGVTNYDIDASEVIWQFFSQYDINGKIGCVISVEEEMENTFSVYPNPTTRFLNVPENLTQNRYQIICIDGRLISSGEIFNNRVDVSDLPKGMYVLKIGHTSSKFSRK